MALSVHLQNFSVEGGNYSVRNILKLGGSGGMLPQKNFEIYNI